MTEHKAPSRRRLTPADWADAGLAAVAVEPLATRLGTTKGSFYWHFRSREALLEAALARWEEQTTTAVLDEIGRVTEGPAAQFRLLIIRVISMAEEDSIGPAL